ncbi:MAG: alpha/beta fold hydrolase [Candidatus Acidiferrales bacterium]
MKEFEPHWGLRNGHVMTIAATFWRRRFPQLSPSAPRLFEVELGTQVRGDCHWQDDPRQHPTLMLLHGLEGSSESAYMFGTAEKAWVTGFNVVRMNQRNCGGTENLTPTLYHSGRSADFRAVVLELIERDALPEIFAAGFSMGGNLVLKMAGEFANSAPQQVRGFAAIAPCFDLAACADALGEPRNFIYNWHFVRGLKSRMRHKARLFPEIYPANGRMERLNRIRTVRGFDDAITAPFCGFASADDYYARSSAMHVLGGITKPTLILKAQDDPFVPFSTFANRALRENPNIALLAPRYGGHCAFISQEDGDKRFWSEARIVEFCKQQSQLLRSGHSS